MSKVLVALVLTTLLSSPAYVFADESGKEVRKHHQEQQREEQKYREELARESRKHHEEQEREARKHKKEHRWEKKHHRKHHTSGEKHNPPRGWRERVAKGKRIDADFYIYFEDVPQNIIKTLPPLPPGVSYKQIEEDIVKIHNANMEILDVFRKTGLPLPPLPKIK